MADGKVSFRWKDYRQEGRRKVMTLDAGEFMRRFLLHVLPPGFHRIRNNSISINALDGLSGLSHHKAHHLC